MINSIVSSDSVSRNWQIVASRIPIALILMFLHVGCSSPVIAEPSENEKHSEVQEIAESGNSKTAFGMQSRKCIDKNNNVLVYPPNDGFGFSRDQNASGKPTEYCDEDELLQKQKNLMKLNDSGNKK